MSGPAFPREGCCADWPKPCQYHEGWEDGYCVAEADRDAIDAAHRTRLDELRRGVLEAVEDQRECTGTSCTFTHFRLLRHAALSLVEHCSPRGVT